MPFSLITDEIRSLVKETIAYFEESGSYSYPASGEYKSANLLKERKGLMFAVLTALTREGEKVVLRGFSGLAESHHQVPG